MASWDIKELVSERQDMDTISKRKKGASFLQTMKQTLFAKIEGVQVISTSSFLTVTDELEKTILPQ